MKKYIEKIISKDLIKRTVSVIVALSLVFTMFNASMFVTNAKNTVQTETFENGIGANDVCNSAFTLYSSTDEGNIAENVHTGENSLKISSGKSMVQYRPQTNIQLEKGKTYKISFWYKATATTVGGTDYQTKSLFYFQINGESGETTRTYHKHTNGEWTQVEKVYTVSDTNSAAEGALSLKFSNYNHPEGAYEVYIDDIVVSSALSISAVAGNGGEAKVNEQSSVVAYAGDTVTFTATPNNEYEFVAWKNSANEVVSTSATYTTTVDEDITLTASFAKSYSNIENFENGIGANDVCNSAFTLYSSTDEGNIAENVHTGENSLKISSGKSMVQYRPQTNIQLEKGKTYKVSFWYKGTATTVGGTDYQTKSLFYFQINGESGETTRTYHKHTNGEWTQVEKVYTVSDTNSAAEGALSLKFSNYNHPEGAYEVYIDDIVVGEQVTVSAACEGNGTALVNGAISITGYTNETVNYVAEPNSGHSFVGWRNSAGAIISTEQTYSHYVTEETTLTACFEDNSRQAEDFEDGKGVNDDWSSSAFQIYNPDIEGYSNENVHQGSNSLKISSAGDWKTYRPNTNIQLEKGKTYTISFWYKATATTDYQASSLFYFQINGEAASTRTYHKHTNGEWTQIEKVYTVSDTNSAAEGKLSLTFASYNHPTGAYEIYLDDISAVEVLSQKVTVTASASANGNASVNGTNKVSVDAGTSIVFKAVADEGYVFDCWKNAEGTPVSDSAEYTHTATTDISLTAYFKKAPDNTQNFEEGLKGDTANRAFSLYNTETEGYDSANVHEGNNSLKATPTGTFSNYYTTESIVLSAGKTYKVTFWYKSTAIDSIGNSAFIFYQPQGKEYNQTDRDYLRTTNGEWVEKTNYFTIGSADTYLQFTTYDKAAGSFEAYVDDVKAVEVRTVNVTASSGANGTALVDGKSSTAAVVGRPITFTATPDEGYAFDCWKDSTGKAVSYLPEYSPVITEELHLTASFIKSKVSDNIQDFEYGLMGDTTQKGFTLYNSQNPGADAANVHDGKASLQFLSVGDWKNYYTDKSITLKSGKYYKVSFWYKATTEELAENATVFYVAPKGTEYKNDRVFLRITNGEWKYSESIVYISGDDTTLAFTAYNKAANSFTAYFDDIKAIELANKPVRVSVAADGNGTVTVNGVPSVYLEAGNEAKLVGTAKKGYYLTCWKDSSGKLISYDDEVILKNLQSDNTYTAYFAPVKQPTGKLDFESKPSDRMQKQFTWYNPLSEGYTKKNVKNGNGSLKVTANGSWGNYWADSSILLKANTSYDISFWYKAESTRTNTILFFKTNIEENQDNRIYLSATKGAWVLKRATIKVGAQDTYLQMILFDVEAGSTVLYFDDIVVEKTNLYKEIPAVQTENFDEQCVENAYGSWNSDKRYTRNNSAGSIKMDGSAVKEGHGTYFYTNFLVEPFTRYKVSVWIYCLDLEHSTGQAQLYSLYGNAYSELRRQPGVWKELSYTFDSGNITTNVLTLGLIVRPGVLYYADDLTLTKLDYEGTYGEDMYNLYKEGSLEAFSDSNWSELPSNFVRTKASDKASANSGKYYLLADGQGTYTRKITIDKVGRYALAASFQNVENGDVKIEILQNGKPLSRIIQNEAGMLLSTDSEEWTRQLLLFDNKEEGTDFEVRITSNGGKVAIDDIALFHAKYLRNENPNDYRAYGDNIKVVNYAVDVKDGNQEDMGNDKMIGIVIIVGSAIALTAIGVGITVLKAKKRREEHEKADN